MLKKLLIAPIFFSSGIMCMQGIIATDQTQLDNANVKRSIELRAIMNVYNNSLQGFRQKVLSPLEVYYLDETVEEDCLTYVSMNGTNATTTSSKKTVCYKAFSLTLAASLAATAVIYRIYCWH